MPNTSATGGYLAPSSTGGDLNDAALAQFLQQVVVGIVGLPGNMVRPRWQAEPPNIPDFDTNWASIGPGPIARETFSYATQSADGLTTTVVRNRTMDILCCFYGPLAGTNSELLAMGLEVPQNREVMQLSNMNLVGGVGAATTVPILFKQRWQYRVDVPFTIRQQQKYTYSVLDLLSIQGEILLQSGSEIITETISVPNAE